MNRETFLDASWALFAKCWDLLDGKSRDYSTEEDAFENVTTAETMGIGKTEEHLLAEVIKKITRIHNILNKDHQPDESAFDSIEDAINYLVFLHLYLEERNGYH